MFTYTKLNGYGEEIGAGSLGDGISALYTWKVDEARLDDTLLALGGLDNLLGKAICSQSVYSSVQLNKHTGIQRKPWKEWLNQHPPLPRQPRHHQTGRA